ncbi:MAG: carbohydrate kinase [Catenulispora sp. 13_1_20CM_3_70_7]|nr:MAG: carbohydrate kinase [Catenulispora sp. 13_1_20CM_3_70_7]
MYDSREATVSRARPVVTVIGEALIDLTPHDGPGAPGMYRARPGGSPFNVAVGLARLGHHTVLMARLADDTFGRILRGHAAAEGIDLAYAPHATEPTTLAVVSLDADARASYDLYFQGTADWQWTAAETARVPDDTAVLHVGSIASWTPPGDERIYALTAASHARGQVLISYDPNVRPRLLGEPGRARLLVERYASVAHIVKASSEDVGWLYPGTDIEQVGARWIELGTIVVVITDGAEGAHLFRAGSAPMHRPGRRVHVVDTVGAGDAFTAGLLDALLRQGLQRPDLVRRSSPAVLSAALDNAILISALTCERVGADPPTSEDLRS